MHSKCIQVLRFPLLSWCTNKRSESCSDFDTTSDCHPKSQRKTVIMSSRLYSKPDDNMASPLNLLTSFYNNALYVL